MKLPGELRWRLRIWAAFLDRESSEIVEEAVAAHLDQFEQERTAHGLPPMPRPEEGRAAGSVPTQEPGEPTRG